MHKKEIMLSGDSTVRFFSFNAKKLEFLYNDSEKETVFRVVVETLIIYSEVTWGEGCVHMRIEPSEDKLEIDKKSNLFILPFEFGKQMAAIKKGHHILAGLKPTEYRSLFILHGNGVIALCPIAGEESVSIKKAKLGVGSHRFCQST